jgi:hypothetical protein
MQVAGLWYILAATILIGLFITSASVAQRWRSGAARASWHEAVSDSLAPGEQFAVKTPKASFWGTTLSFKPRPSAGPASRGEQEPRSPLSPVHRNSMLSRFATSASAGKHDAAAAATAASGGAEEATTQVEAFDKGSDSPVAQALPLDRGAWHAAAAIHAEASEGH